MKHMIFTLFFVLTLGCTAAGSGSDNALNSNPDGTKLSAALTTAAGDGVILDCWQWTFSGIQSNLAAISAAGYSAIEVSPVQLTKTSSTSMSWYLFYQPCNLHVGNAQLGSAQDFTNLCNAAKPYGIKIIVDAVLNQVADNGSSGGFDPNVDATIRANAGSWFHNLGTVVDWTNRYDMTQQNLGNGPDWNTQNSTVQQMHLAFLNECINDGAGGFRFDAAKSIETNVGNDAGQSWAGSYWTTMMNGMTGSAGLFCYGEVLPDYNDNEQGYQTFMRTTTTGYIGTISSAIDSTNLSTANVMNVIHNIGNIYNETPAKSVIYIENWDNYNGSVGINTSGFSYTKRLLANAIMSSRAGMVNILFTRPNENLWSDPVMKAVNNFKNFALGSTEYLRNPNGTTSVLIIERGTAGMVIVNTGGSQYITSATNLPAGTYTDKGPSGATFTVSNGTLTGNMPSTTAVVLQGGGVISIPAAPATTSVGSATSSSLTVSWAASTGATSYTVWQSTSSTGTYTSAGTAAGTSLVVSGLNASTTYYYKVTATNSAGTSGYSPVASAATTAPVAGLKVHFKANSYANWTSVYCYYWASTGSPTANAWPGSAMTSEGSSWWVFTIPASSSANIIFDNNSAQTVDLSRATSEGWFLPTGTSGGKVTGTWSNSNPDVVTIPAAPATTSVGSATSNSLTVSWAASTGAASYTVYQSNSSTGTFASAGTATGTSLVVSGLTASTTYYYKVTATNGAGTSGYSPVASGATTAVATGLKVHFKVNTYANWTNVNCYFWAANGSTVSNSWPGTAMASEGNNWWVFTVPGSATSANIIFDNGSVQTIDLSRTGEGWYVPTGTTSGKVTGTWYSTNPGI